MMMLAGAPLVGGLAAATGIGWMIKSRRDRRDQYSQLTASSSTSHIGYLAKQGEYNLHRKWRRRWMEIRGANLIYYLGPADGMPRGFIALATLVVLDHQRECGQEFAFKLVDEAVVDGGSPKGDSWLGAARTFLLAADSEVEKVEWMGKLMAATRLAADTV
jgi:hypothetical protein